MSNFDDEDLEIEAIAKCAKALSRLDNESKTRVIRYLLEAGSALIVSTFVSLFVGGNCFSAPIN